MPNKQHRHKYQSNESEAFNLKVVLQLLHYYYGLIDQLVGRT